MKNLIGQAIHTYYTLADNTAISTFIDDEQDAEMPPSLFFRSLKGMNHIERMALKLCKGKVLDIGAGAGCHSIILQNQKMDVVALELSEEACAVLKARGIRKVVQQDLYKHNEKYDTILLLMNGFGLARKKSELPKFLLHLKSMLNPQGQIIGDSTDIHYLFQNVLHQKEYFGEVQFKLRYKNEEESFPWIYADEELLKETAHKCGLHCDILKRNRNDAFLVRMIE